MSMMSIALNESMPALSIGGRDFQCAPPKKGRERKMVGPIDMSNSVRCSGKGESLQLPEPLPTARPIHRWVSGNLSIFLASTSLSAVCILGLIAPRVIHSHAGTIRVPSSRDHASAEIKTTTDGPQAPAPSAVFGDLRMRVPAVRIVIDALEEFRTSLRIEIENTHSNLKDDDFEFSLLACELADNYGNIYRPIPPADLEHGLYDRRPLYPRSRRVINVEFERPVPGFQWLELRMSPPRRRALGGARMRIGIPASLIEGLENLGRRGAVRSRGCEEE
jgi:hypothetical protein